MKTYFSLLLFVFVAQYVWAQDVFFTVDNKGINAEFIEQNNSQHLINQNRRATRPLGVSTGLSLPLGSGSGVAFASVDYFVVPQLSLETNIGRTFGNRSYYALGAKYHLNSRYSDNKFAPFVGFLLDTEYQKSMVLIPIGFSFISDNGFYASFSFNQFMFFDLKTDTNFEFKFGYRRRK